MATFVVRNGGLTIRQRKLEEDPSASLRRERPLERRRHRHVVFGVCRMMCKKLFGFGGPHGCEVSHS